ncbi:hypothetical protein [Aurantimicrobium minutum]|jgi:hypothetical protein|uniref:Uncharacterized protein n=1 Tax=Aurantimicrobium minutum TaxID=708131 RepID=A0A173LWK6_9MICO|nr:hypothetical protein [Aurantimicrobium minutum]MDH6239677.1 hypothetical protein [Aurantimicrobium minutum]BAU99376.1 Uncharacterized protein AUMI_18340 [Aurantimicrobium minutum]
MIDWFTALQIGVAVTGGLLAVVLGAIGRRPSDLTMAFAGVVALLLIVQLAVTIASPLMGNEPTGSLFEFYIYLISAIFIPIATGFWALIDRSRWSTIILGVGQLAVAIMLYRMGQIWFIQVA